MIEVGDIVQYNGPDFVLSTGEVGEVVQIDGDLCEIETLCGQCMWAKVVHLTIISLNIDDFREMQVIKQTYEVYEDEDCD